MSHVQSSLLPSERMVLSARFSSIPLVLGFCWVLFWILVTALLAMAGPVAIIGLLGIGLSICACIRIVVVMATTQILVTNQRFIGKSGFISRASVELLLTKLESMEVAQGLGGRLFDYGNLRIRGSGTGRMEFRYLKSPLRVRRACVGAAEEAQRNAATSTVAEVLMQPPLEPTVNIAAPSASALFEVKIADPQTGAERWVDVRAATREQARSLAAATGELVGEARLKSIG